MKKLTPLALLVLLLFNGCARNYVIKLNSGRELGAQGRPELRGGAYYFKDANGQPTSVPAGRVSQIEPASSASRGKKTGFIDSGTK